MKIRSSHVRSKIVALLVCIVALWTFAAYITVHDGLNLVWVKTLDQQVGRPTDTVITALQEERRLSLVFLGSGRTESRHSLDLARAATDAAGLHLRDSAGSTQARLAASGSAAQRITDLFASLAGLADARASIDSGGSDRTVAAGRYNATIDTAFLIYDSLAQFTDEEIAAQGRSIVRLTRCRELLAREDSVLSGVIAHGTFTASEPDQFTMLVGAQRTLYTDAAARLTAPDQVRWRQLSAGPTFVRFHAVEDLVVQKAKENTAPPVTTASWREAINPLLSALHTLELSLADTTVSRAAPAAAWTVVRLVLAGGLGLVAVIASIVVSISTVKTVNRRLGQLRNAALELASSRLPRVVERLQHGEKVDIAHEAPPLHIGDDEIGQVSQAFNEVQETAIRVAVEQAELRQNVRGVFLSLARRSQALLHRQLGLLDAMERRATDAEELAELFRVDHLATRMRRNAENLIVLSGATAGRAWRKPVPVIDVVRAALAEVEDYTRVTVLPLGPTAVIGRAVGDVIHLLAELIENAVSFSPPQSVVRVGGSVVGNGFAIEIEDRGLGMSEAARAAANEQLSNAPEFKLSSTARLGLYVVGKLAERHDVRVRLIESPFGGTTAIVVLPPTLLAEEPPSENPLYSEVSTGSTRSTGAASRKEPRLDRPAGSSALADEPIAITPSGLPWRPRRQRRPTQSTTDSDEATNGAGANGTDGADQTRDGRAPQQVRDMMSAYRSGTLRGRSAAAHPAELPLADPSQTEPTSPTESTMLTESTSPTEPTLPTDDGRQATT